MDHACITEALCELTDWLPTPIHQPWVCNPVSSYHVELIPHGLSGGVSTDWDQEYEGARSLCRMGLPSRRTGHYLWMWNCSTDYGTPASLFTDGTTQHIWGPSWIQWFCLSLHQLLARVHLTLCLKTLRRRRLPKTDLNRDPKVIFKSSPLNAIFDQPVWDRTVGLLVIILLFSEFKQSNTSVSTKLQYHTSCKAEPCMTKQMQRKKINWQFSENLFLFVFFVYLT